jgi:hypothetical protein
VRRLSVVFTALIFLAALLPSRSRAAWPANGIELTSGAFAEVTPTPVIATDGASGAIVAWQQRFNGTSTGIGLQRVDSLGNIHWPAGGIFQGVAGFRMRELGLAPAPSLGAALVWAQLDGTSTPTVMAQRYDSAGVQHWGGSGLVLGPSGTTFPTIVGNGSSGLVDPIGFYVALWAPGGVSNVRLQFADLAGSLWRPSSEGGILIDPGEQAVSETPACVQDGIGAVGRARGVYVAWSRTPSGGNFEIRLQHVRPDSSIAFPTGGLLLSPTAAGVRSNPSIAMVGGGSVVVAWTDFRSGEGDIYAQKVTSSGTFQWTGLAGLQICTAPDDQFDPKVVPDGSGGAIISWMDQRDGHQVTYAQHISAAGNALWGLGGIPISASTDIQAGSDLLSDGASGAIVGWEVGDTDSSQERMQRIDTNGQPVWGPGALIDNSTGVKGAPVLVGDLSFGALAAWNVVRAPETLAHVYLYRLTSGHALDVPVASAASSLRLSLASPNPSRRGAVLRLDMAAAAEVNASVFDAAGRRVRTLIDGEAFGAGAHALVWDGRDERGAPVAPGAYMVRARADSRQAAAKVIVLR